MKNYGELYCIGLMIYDGLVDADAWKLSAKEFETPCLGLRYYGCCFQKKEKKNVLGLRQISF